MKAHRWIAAACLLIAAMSDRPAGAALVLTYPIEDVLPGASHVVRVSLPARDDGTYEIQHVYRGAFEGDSLEVHRMPLPVELARRFPGHRGPFEPERGKPAGLILALYEMDGRFHVVGERPPHGVTPHSSAWLVDAAGRVHSFRQVINPGSPVPVPAEPESLPEFEKRLGELLVEHPFRGADHRRLPKDQREPFLAIVEPELDWYERRTANQELGSGERVKIAHRLRDYAAEAPESMAVPVFDALQMLADVNGHASGHEAELTRLMIAHVKRWGAKRFAEPILRELDEGPYWWRNRSALLAVAKAVDADLYRLACGVLVALGKRQSHNEGLAAYWALVQNGEKELAEEVKRAQGDAWK